MPTILDRIPKRKFSKTEICQILIDPENFIAGNLTAIKTITMRDKQNLKRDIIAQQLLPVFGITEQQYNTIKNLPVTWCEIIFQKLM